MFLFCLLWDKLSRNSNVKKIFLFAVLSFVLVPTVVLANVVLQGPHGERTYFHKEGKSIVISKCKRGVFIDARTAEGIIISDYEGWKYCYEPASVREVSEQMFANHLKLIMLSDRITFDSNVQAKADLYKEHGSLFNLEILQRRQERLEKELTISEARDLDLVNQYLRKRQLGALKIKMPP